MKLTNASRMLGVMAFAAIVSPSAFSLDSDQAYDANWYIGANIGKSRADIDDGRIINNLLEGGLTTTAIENDERDKGYKLFGGYQFNRYFAIEGGYFDLGKFDFTATTMPLGTLDGNIKLKGINLDLVGFFPFTDKFSAFARVGVNYADTKDIFGGSGAVIVLNQEASDRAANLKLGVGVQYDFTYAWALRLETERYRVNDGVGNKGDIDLASIGLIYRFGTKPAPVVPAYVEPVRAPLPAIAPPPPPPPAPRFVKYSLSANELFAFDSAEVRMPQLKLDEIAKALKGEGAPPHIIITGYTDRLGSDEYNQKLSERRALGVKNYMISKGVDPERLASEGRGEANPVVICTEKSLPLLINCLTPNRRVEIDEMTIVKEVKK